MEILNRFWEKLASSFAVQRMACMPTFCYLALSKMTKNDIDMHDVTLGAFCHKN